MRNFFYRVSSALARFMYGRNGADQLGTAMLVLYLVIVVMQPFFGKLAAVQIVLEAVSQVLAALVLFRMFSRNLTRRRGRNTPPW